MLIQKLRERVDSLLGRVPGSRLGLFGDRVRDAARVVVGEWLHRIEAHVAQLFGEGGSYRDGVGYLRWFLKAYLGTRLPWYVRAVVSVDRAVDRLCDYLLEIEPDVAATIGHVE